MTGKQSQHDRLTRISEGRCPVHGGFMSQVDGWYHPADRPPYTIVGCSRRDCAIEARAEGYDGPWELREEFGPLLDESVPDPPYVIAGVDPRPSRTRPRVCREEIVAKTGGRCYFCGLYQPEGLTLDHLVPLAVEVDHRPDNLVPACRSCNSAKGAKDLEAFRFFRSMQVFCVSTGVMFSREQVEYLRGIGTALKISRHVFWFEQSHGSR